MEVFNMIKGRQNTYGHPVGIVMLESYVPRIPGDPGHAATLNYTVCYETIKGYSFPKLVDIDFTDFENVIESVTTLAPIFHQ